MIFSNSFISKVAVHTRDLLLVTCSVYLAMMGVSLL